MEELSNISNSYVSAHPNAGLPNPLSETGYDETPEAIAADLREWAASGLLNIVGGCCGTTPPHIKAIAEAVQGLPPRAIPEIEKKLRLSGLEALNIGEDSLFVNVGERANVTGSKMFARLILNGEYDKALEVAKAQVENGAQIIDINMDEAMLDSEAAMVKFLNLIASEPDIAKVPVMIDSSKWSVIEAGLKCVQGKSIVNSISMKEGEAEFIERARLCRRYGAAAVVMAFDEQGQADTQARKIEICARSYKLLTEQVGFPAEDIIFDPNIFAVATGIEEHNNYAVDFIEATRIDQAEPALRQDLRRRVQRVLLLPRQRAGARGDPHRLPVSRHQGRHGHGHRQCRPARRLRRNPQGPAGAGRGRAARIAARMRPSAWWSSPKPSRARPRARSRISPGARRRCASGWPMPWSGASPRISSKTPKKPGSRRSARST